MMIKKNQEKMMIKKNWEKIMIKKNQEKNDDKEESGKIMTVLIIGEILRLFSSNGLMI